jgi:tetratricopeptide (TPR) repeat protein
MRGVSDRRGSSGSIARVALAGALAWSPPTLAFAADAEATGAPSKILVYHTIEPGETIWEIANRYGSSVADVIRENEIEDTRKIWAGTRLRIPFPSDADPSRHAERRADTQEPGAAETSALLDRCEAALRAAHFEQALASADEARDRIDARNEAAHDPDRVRLEIASATAYVALGQNDAALESFERALIADPDLELDPALISPKVLTVFRAARGPAAPRR